QIIDRYSAMGIPRPDEGSCKGDCEATGYVPIFMRPKHVPDGNVFVSDNEDDPRYVSLWNAGHRQSCTVRGILHSLLHAKSVTPTGTGDYVRWLLRRLFNRRRCDGWHFVTCPDCNGTRREVKAS